MYTTKNLLILIGRNVLISLIAISITLVAVIFLSKKIRHVSDSIALNHRLEGELKKRIALSEVLKHDSQIIGTNDTVIENAFAPSDNILGFINSLDNLAAKNNIHQTYRFETPIESTISAPFPIATILYSNVLGGNVSSFSNYLKEFNQLPYFTKIEGFSISSQDKLGWVGESTISFQATLYTKAIQ